MRPYPPKLSNMIMSSSTPNEWSRSSTVLDIIGGPQRYPIKQGSQKSADFWEEEEVRQAKLACEFLLASHFRRGPPMMSKTVLDLLHSLGVEDDMIMFDNFGG